MPKNKHIDKDKLSVIGRFRLAFRQGKLSKKGRDYTADERPAIKNKHKTVEELAEAIKKDKQENPDKYRLAK